MKYLLPLLLLLTACAPSESVIQTAIAETQAAQPTEPVVSERFREKMLDFLDAGTLMTSQTEQGVNFADFGTHLAETRAAYQSAVDVWPDEFALEAHTDLERAVLGWTLAHGLWEWDLDGRHLLMRYAVDSPQGQLRDAILDYGDDAILIQETSGGETYVAGPENISILLALAADDFVEGKTAALHALGE